MAGTGRTHKEFLVLALLAVLSTLAQPVCAALDLRLPAFHFSQASHPADSDSEGHTPCCAEAQSSALALAPSAIAAETAVFAAHAVALPAGRVVPRKAFVPAASTALSGAAPPVPLSYYARSARILR